MQSLKAWNYPTVNRLKWLEDFGVLAIFKWVWQTNCKAVIKLFSHQPAIVPSSPPEALLGLLPSYMCYRSWYGLDNQVLPFTEVMETLNFFHLLLTLWKKNEQSSTGSKSGVRPVHSMHISAHHCFSWLKNVHTNFNWLKSQAVSVSLIFPALCWVYWK